MTNSVKTTIERVVQGGKGLARIEEGVVLIDRVLPGEKVRVETRRRKGVFEGDLIAVEESSSHRVIPDCPFYDRCGGCDFRHTDYDHEIVLKTEMLRDTLHRIGKVDLERVGIEVLPSPQRNRYRIRTKIQCDGNVKGFYARGSHSIVPVDDCLLIPDHLVDLLRKARCRRPFILASHPLNEEGWRLGMGEEGRPFSFAIDGLTLFHLPGNFMQANRFLLSAFIERATTLLGEGETIWELYAGSGFFTLPLSRRYTRVNAMEWSKASVAMLHRSLESNGITNVRIIRKDCAEWRSEHADAILLDPPREGIPASLSAAINAAEVKRVLYVSCNAATLARDIGRLDAFTVEKLVLIDMFPGTAHYETMALLKRLPPASSD